MYELVERSIITLTTGDELIVLYCSSKININSILLCGLYQNNL